MLGKRLGKGMGAAAEAIKQLTTADIVAYEATGTLTLGDLELKEGDLKVCLASMWAEPGADTFSHYRGVWLSGSLLVWPGHGMVVSSLTGVQPWRVFPVAT